MAKSVLSIDDLGRYETFLFISSTVSFFWVTGIMQTLLGWQNKENQIEHKSTLFFSSFLLLILLSLLSAILVYIAMHINQLGTFSKLNNNEKAILIIFLIINPPGFLVEYILFLKKKFRYLIFYGLASIIVPGILVSIPAFLGFGLAVCLYGLVVWGIIKLLILWYLLALYSSIKYNKKEIGQLLGSAMPLIGTALIVGSASYVDGIIITTNYDADTFAIFRFGAREFPLFSLIASAFGTSLIPLISETKNIEKELTFIKNKSRQMIYFLFPVAIVFILTSQYLFPIVFNAGFEKSYKIFDIYLLLIISRFVFPQSILMGFQKNRTILFVSSIELIINILSSLIFIHYFGYIGVAYGTVLAYFTEKILLIKKVNKTLNIGAPKYIPAKQLALYSLLLISIYILKNI